MPRYLSPRAPRTIARALLHVPGAGIALGLLWADVVMLLTLGAGA